MTKINQSQAHEEFSSLVPFENDHSLVGHLLLLKQMETHRKMSNYHQIQKRFASLRSKNDKIRLDKLLCGESPEILDSKSTDTRFRIRLCSLLL